MTYVVAFLVAFVAIADEKGQTRDPAVVVSLRRPDLQLARLIDLFRETRAKDPAAALAAWKNATHGERSMGKAAEAGIAALNSRMVHELKIFDHATLLLDLATGDMARRWCVCVPHDDGTLAAVATAATLTDGMVQPNLDRASVDRLGPEGAAMMARSEDRVVVAPSRDQLAKGLGWLHDHPELSQVEKPALDKEENSSGTTLLINPESLSRSSSLTVRQVGEMLLEMGWHKPHAAFSLVDRGLIGKAVWSEAEGGDGPDCHLDPKWLKSLPLKASAAFSVALDPRPATWDRFFAVMDAWEKADPSRADRASLRTRWNLLATASRLDPERDLLPKLVGISGFVLGNVTSIDGLAIGIHTRDDEAAATLRKTFLPSLARSLRLPDAGPATDGRRVLGRVEGRAIVMIEETGPDVWIVWGESASTAIELAHREPSTSRFAALGEQDVNGLSRIGWVNLASWIDESVPFAVSQALDVAKPLEWTGRSHGGTQWDRLSLRDLHPVVRRFLELVPQEPLSDPGRE